MNYGMRCHDICQPSDVDTVLKAVKENGIPHIQLAMGKSFQGLDFTPGHYSPGLAHMIGQKLKENEIHVSVLGCYINPVNPNEAQRRSDINKFIEHLKYARILGADMVGTETGRYDPFFQVVPYTYTEGCYQLFLKSMKEIVSAAENLGVIVGIEAVHDHTIYCPELMRRFLDDIDSPNVEAILDPVNLISAENYKNQDEVISKAFSYYGDRITMLHIKDFRMTDQGPASANIGEGLFHYDPLLKYIKTQKPYITMLLEESNPTRCHQDINYLQTLYTSI